MRKLTHDELANQRVPSDKSDNIERMPVYALLDNVRSLYNVGSIFRTSDGGLVQRLILTGYTPTPPRKEIEKTALGATSTVPWEYQKNPLNAIERLRREGVRVYVVEHTTPSRPYFAVSREEFPLCIVVGNELTGVSPGIIEIADGGLEIPMYGTKQSLNVAVAYGIALFELVRTWKQPGGQGTSKARV